MNTFVGDESYFQEMMATKPANEVEPVIVVLRRMNYHELPTQRGFFAYKQSSIPS